MLIESPFKIVGHTNIHHFIVPIRKDVHIEVVVFHWRSCYVISMDTPRHLRPGQVCAALPARRACCSAGVARNLFVRDKGFSSLRSSKRQCMRRLSFQLFYCPGKVDGRVTMGSSREKNPCP